MCFFNFLFFLGRKSLPFIFLLISPQAFAEGSSKIQEIQKTPRGLEVTVGDKKILIEEARKDQIKKFTPSHLRRLTFFRSIYQFPQQALPFYTAIFALAAIQAGVDWRKNPASMENFVHEMKDPLGHVSFWAFIFVNHNVSYFLNSKFETGRVFFPYIGMAMGSIASDISYQALADPDIRKCSHVLSGILTQKEFHKRNMDSCDRAYLRWTSSSHWWRLSPTVLHLVIGAALSGANIKFVLKPLMNVGKKTILAKPIATTFSILSPHRKFSWFVHSFLHAFHFLSWLGFVEKPVRNAYFWLWKSRSLSSDILDHREELDELLSKKGKMSEKDIKDSLERVTDVRDSYLFWKQEHILYDVNVSNFHWFSFFEEAYGKMRSFQYFVLYYINSILGGRHVSYFFSTDVVPDLTSGSHSFLENQREEIFYLGERFWKLDVDEDLWNQALRSPAFQAYKKEIANKARSYEINERTDFIKVLVTLSMISLEIQKALKKMPHSIWKQDEKELGNLKKLAADLFLTSSQSVFEDMESFFKKEKSLLNSLNELMNSFYPMILLKKGSAYDPLKKSLGNVDEYWKGNWSSPLHGVSSDVVPYFTYEGKPLIPELAGGRIFELGSRVWPLDLTKEEAKELDRKRIYSFYNAQIIAPFLEEDLLSSSSSFLPFVSLLREKKEDIKKLMVLLVSSVRLKQGIRDSKNQYTSRKYKDVLKRLEKIADLLSQDVGEDFSHPDLRLVGQGVKDLNLFFKNSFSKILSSHDPQIFPLRKALMEIFQYWGRPRFYEGDKGFVDFVTEDMRQYGLIQGNSIPYKGPGSNLVPRNLGDYYLIAMICGKEYIKSSEGNGLFHTSLKFHELERIFEFRKGLRLDFHPFRMINKTPEETRRICKKNNAPVTPHPKKKRVEFLKKSNVLDIPLEFEGKFYHGYDELLRKNFILDIDAEEFFNLDSQGIQKVRELVFSHVEENVIGYLEEKRVEDMSEKFNKALFSKEEVNGMPEGLLETTRVELNFYFGLLDRQFESFKEKFPEVENYKYDVIKKSLLAGLDEMSELAKAKKFQDVRIRFRHMVKDIYMLYFIFGRDHKDDEDMRWIRDQVFSVENSVADLKTGMEAHLSIHEKYKSFKEGLPEELVSLVLYQLYELLDQTASSFNLTSILSTYSLEKGGHIEEKQRRLEDPRRKGFFR